MMDVAMVAMITMVMGWVTVCCIGGLKPQGLNLINIFARLTMCPRVQSSESFNSSLRLCKYLGSNHLSNIECRPITGQELKFIIIYIIYYSLVLVKHGGIQNQDDWPSWIQTGLTICPRSLDLYIMVSYYIKSVKPSWTHSRSC